MPDSIVIAIPTFKRPRSLARLLEAIARLETGTCVSVLVADNDAQDHQGHDLCLNLKNYRWPLTSMIAPMRGIASVRNILVEAALKDPDEWVRGQATSAADDIEQFLGWKLDRP